MTATLVMAILLAAQQEPTRSVVIEAEGLGCPACTESLRRALMRLPAVRSVEVRRATEAGAVARVVQGVSGEVDHEAVERFLRGFELRSARAILAGEIRAQGEELVLIEEGSSRAWKILPGRAARMRGRWTALREHAAAGPAHVRLEVDLAERGQAVLRDWRRPAPAND